MGQYPYQKSNKGLIFFIILLILIGGGFVIYHFNLFHVKEKVRGIFMLNPVVQEQSPQLQTIQIISPPTEIAWCRIQDYPVAESTFEPQTHRIIGWDDANKGCIVETTGYDECLNKSVVFQYAFIGNLNGNVIWATMDGFFISKPTDYINHIKKIHKLSFDYSYANFAGCECLTFPGIYQNKVIKPEVEHQCV